MSVVDKFREAVTSVLPLSIPFAIILANAVLPLQPLVRQVLMAILLVWLYVVVLTDWFFPGPSVGKEKRMRASFNLELYRRTLFALAAVAGTTFVLALIGREKVGEAVIALLYLVPVGWSASKWGQGAGIAAAVAASLCFDFFFIPPFYTMTVGSLESWLVLAIFLAVAILVVNRIQESLSRAQTSEHEAILMYELSSALAGLQTQEAVAHTVARFLQERYLAPLATISIQPRGNFPEINAYEPQSGVMKGKPDCILPILNVWGLIGEIQLWRGEVELPIADSRLFRNFASQIGQALERTRLAETHSGVVNGTSIR